MRIQHVALVCRSERNADRFYGDFLGLEKSGTKRIPPEIAEPLFHIVGGIQALDFIGDTIHFEVFIHDGPGEEIGPVAHVCLEVKDRDALLAKARAMDVSVIRVPRGDREVIFLKDLDGNLFEIKKPIGC